MRAESGLLYGGLGEGSGFGLGVAQEIPPRPEPQASDYLRDDRIVGLRLMARMSPLSGYQELSASFETSPLPRSSFIVHTDYQLAAKRAVLRSGSRTRYRPTNRTSRYDSGSAGAFVEVQPTPRFLASDQSIERDC